MGFSKGNKLGKTHGMWGSPTYRSWNNMKNRCTNPSNPRWNRYGGRGIAYCREWEDFNKFFEDMGVRPIGKTLDRIDNNLGYSKDNCKWSTPSEQNRNRSTRSSTNIKYIYKHKDRFIVRVYPIARSFHATTLEEAKKIKLELQEFLKSVTYKEGTMQVEQITLTRRKPEEQYGHSEITVTATLSEGEDLYLAGIALKEQVYALLGLGQVVKAPVPVKELTTKPEVKPEPVKEEVKETPKKEEAPKKEKVVKEPKKPKEPTPSIKYDREVEAHRDEFASILNKEFPGWQTNADMKAKAKACSMAMPGEYIFDSEGKVLKSFVDNIKAKMA
jgi:hypothetical protein